MNAVIEAAIEADERRARRDSYRAAGGSKRRPLCSFMTDREKRQARDEHAERLRLAVAELREPTGFARWAEALQLNPHLTPMNAALVAMQTPGAIVNTSANWRTQGARVRKGESAAGRLTGRGFWPVAYFTAAQAGAVDLIDLDPPETDDRALDAQRLALVARLEAGEKARDAVNAAAEPYRTEEA